jgi:murein L,D-transpeptidase YcbB/YkuD
MPAFAGPSSGLEHMVRLAKPIPVHLLYWTTWVDAHGTVQFRNDLYGRDALVIEQLRELPPK